MEPQNFTASFLVDQSPKTAFDAIQNFRAWWSQDIEGEPNKLDEAFIHRYKDVHLCKFKLIEIIPYSKLIYLVVDNHFSFTKDKTEWVNTKLMFDISIVEEKTKVQFTHEGLVPEYECYDICSNAWSKFILKSLHDLIATGKGQPNTKEST